MGYVRVEPVTEGEADEEAVEECSERVTPASRRDRQMPDLVREHADLHEYEGECRCAPKQHQRIQGAKQRCEQGAVGTDEDDCEHDVPRGRGFKDASGTELLGELRAGTLQPMKVIRSTRAMRRSLRRHGSSFVRVWRIRTEQHHSSKCLRSMFRGRQRCRPITGNDRRAGAGSRIVVPVRSGAGSQRSRAGRQRRHRPRPGCVTARQPW